MSKVSNPKKVGLIGRVDPECRLYDGQTVKTRMMYRLLCNMYGEDAIVTVDTYDYKHRALAVMASYVRCLMQCDRLVVSLSTNGRKVFFPLLSFASRHMGKKVYHNLIGGWLASNLEKYPKWVKYLNSFEVNWVEAHALVDRLSEKGVRNAEYLPNFKYLDTPDVLTQAPLHTDGESFRFCTFSRVIEQKGVTDAARIVEALNTQGRACDLDVYGPVDEGYKPDFEAMLAKCPHVEYRGCVPPEKSVETVAPYDALLFPTKWKQEGIPGTIIDALAAGTPVIAAKWPYYAEMLEDNVTGLGYPMGDNAQLEGALVEFMSFNDDFRQSMSRDCLDRARQYSPKTVAPRIFQAIEGGQSR